MHRESAEGTPDKMDPWAFVRPRAKMATPPTTASLPPPTDVVTACDTPACAEPVCAEPVRAEAPAPVQDRERASVKPAPTKAVEKEVASLPPKHKNHNNGKKKGNYDRSSRFAKSSAPAPTATPTATPSPLDMRRVKKLGDSFEDFYSMARDVGVEGKLVCNKNDGTTVAVEIVSIDKASKTVKMDIPGCAGANFTEDVIRTLASKGTVFSRA